MKYFCVCSRMERHPTMSKIIFQTICQKCAHHKEISFFYVWPRFLLVIEIYKINPFCSFYCILELFFSPSFHSEHNRALCSTINKTPRWQMYRIIIHRKYENSLCTKSTNQHGCMHAYTLIVLTAWIHKQVKRVNQTRCLLNKILWVPINRNSLVIFTTYWWIVHQHQYWQTNEATTSIVVS